MTLGSFLLHMVYCNILYQLTKFILREIKCTVFYVSAAFLRKMIIDSGPTQPMIFARWLIEESSLSQTLHSAVVMSYLL